MSKLTASAALAAAIALPATAALAQDAQPENSENDVRAVLSLNGPGEGGRFAIEIDGLKDAESCLRQAFVHAFNQRYYSDANVSCLQDGETIAAQTCKNNGSEVTCNRITFD